MPNEYCLQKKSLHTWQYVTWYSDLDQAKRNFNVASKEGNGYSWRLVEVKVVEEKLLDGERKAEPGDDVSYDEVSSEIIRSMNEHAKPDLKPTGEFKSSWGAPVASGWGKPTSEAAIKPEHGLTGSVWVGNPKTKEKRRVVGFEANRMLTEGWIKVGPRTVL